MAERLARCAAAHEALLLDLDDLTFIDATGARLLVEAIDASRRDGWSLTITRGSRQVRRLFQLLALTETLPYDDGTAPRGQRRA